MNKQIIILIIASIAIVGATGVGAYNILSDSDMNQQNFDNIKVSVPADAQFTQTLAGYEDNKYGITINTFKSKDAMVNFLDNKTNAQMIALGDIPPQSVAFTEGNTTNIIITNINGNEGICIGALDQNLTVKMANSVVFSNGHKSVKDNGFLGLHKKPLNLESDFKMMMFLLAQVQIKNSAFNVSSFSSIINNIINNNITNSNVNINNSNTNNDGTPLSESECRNIANEALPTGYSLGSASHTGDTYTFSVTNNKGGDGGSISVDDISGQIISSNIIPENTDSTDPTENETENSVDSISTESVNPEDTQVPDQSQSQSSQPA